MKRKRSLNGHGKDGRTLNQACFHLDALCVPVLIHRFNFPEDPLSPAPNVLLTLTRLFLELSQFSQALSVIQVILALDDQEVEAWYLEGWCFVLMAERSKETGQAVEGLTFEELAKDARDCLEMCQMVTLYSSPY